MKRKIVIVSSLLFFLTMAALTLGSNVILKYSLPKVAVEEVSQGWLSPENQNSYDILIPNRAIFKDEDGGNYVWKIEEKDNPLGKRYLAKKAVVIVIDSNEDMSEVVGEIEAGDNVIIYFEAKIENGQQVSVEE